MKLLVVSTHILFRGRVSTFIHDCHTERSTVCNGGTEPKPGWVRFQDSWTHPLVSIEKKLV